MGKKSYDDTEEKGHGSEAFKKLSKLLFVIVGIEILFTFILMLIVKFTLVNNQWDQKYLDNYI